MKKIFTIVVVLFATLLNVSAQGYETPENELSVSGGIGSHPFIAISFGEAFAGIIDGDNSSNHMVGAYSLTYLHNCSKHLGIGLSATYEYMYKNGKEGKKYSENFLTFMPTMRTYWFRSKAFGMYSRLAAGISLEMYDGYKDSQSKEMESKCDKLFAFHVAPVSFEFGSNKVSGFVELGYGFQGIVNAGLKFGF